MTIPQTTYPENLARGLEGQVSDAGGDTHARTRVNVSADMDFGRGVMLGANDDEVVLPTGVAADFVGITQFSQVGSDDTTSTGIPQNTPANIFRKGRIKVIPENAVAPGDPVYMRFQNAGAAPEGNGRFRSDDDAASGDVVQLDTVHSIRWASSAAAGEIAILELNMP